MLRPVIGDVAGVHSPVTASAHGPRPAASAGSAHFSTITTDSKDRPCTRPPNPPAAARSPN
jgi:hypothetical protein